MTHCLKVFIVEEHTEALEVLSLAVRRGILKPENCQFVHLDSHPDLSCFEGILPEHIRDRAELCHRLRNSEDGISSFILPAIAMGLLNGVIWIRPPWTEQIPDGDHPRMVFGWTKQEAGQKMAMLTDFPYWKDDGNAICCRSELTNTTEFDLVVQTIEQWACASQSSSDKAHKRKRSADVCSKDVPNDSSNGDWVLDICLDYFSCANPLQVPDLPEHISTAEEIACMLTTLREALQAQLQQGLRRPPSICTIARSEQDGFTPSPQAAGLEESVLSVLRDVFGAIKVYNIPSFECFYDVDFIRSVK